MSTRGWPSSWSRRWGGPGGSYRSCTATRSTRSATRSSACPSAGRRELAAWGADGAPVVDVVMPNIFGEHGVPNYNSVVATFCHPLAPARPRTWSTTRSCPWSMWADRRPAAGQALAPTPGRSGSRSAHDGQRSRRAADGHRRRLPDRLVAGPVGSVHQGTLQHLPLAHLPRALPDPPAGARPTTAAGAWSRPSRAQAGRPRSSTPRPTPASPAASTGTGTRWSGFSCSPGRPRSGCGSCSRDEVVTFPVSGERAGDRGHADAVGALDHQHGQSELLTLFYADEVFDPGAPDTYPEDGEREGDDGGRHAAGDHPARRGDARLERPGSTTCWSTPARTGTISSTRCSSRSWGCELPDHVLGVDVARWAPPLVISCARPRRADAGAAGCIARAR